MLSLLSVSQLEHSLSQLSFLTACLLPRANLASTGRWWARTWVGFSCHPQTYIGGRNVSVSYDNQGQGRGWRTELQAFWRRGTCSSIHSDRRDRWNRAWSGTGRQAVVSGSFALTLPACLPCLSSPLLPPLSLLHMLSSLCDIPLPLLC